MWTIIIKVLIIKVIFVHSLLALAGSIRQKSMPDFEHKVTLDFGNGLINVTSEDVGQENLKISISVKIPGPGLFQYETPLKNRGGSFILTTPHHAHTYFSSGKVQLRHVSIDYSIKSFYNSDENCFSMFFHAKNKEGEKQVDTLRSNQRHKSARMCINDNQPMLTNGNKQLMNSRMKRKTKNHRSNIYTE